MDRSVSGNLKLGNRAYIALVTARRQGAKTNPPRLGTSCAIEYGKDRTKHAAYVRAATSPHATFSAPGTDRLSFRH
ncbi:hypothetical protein AKJ09_05840 [Labilithrix luteola]|uniref:Uncharacterized protein n=1 Tax=Labilithrix luteola TaxID=1391654 RepID=A0A0K1Q0K9_9BACT|nr:hypothetical protein AKJ09_05840 [Labilithrix luteola]